LPLYDLATIATATNNFSLSNKIGEGGFGPVYKGVLPKGQEIAIKRLSKNSRQGFQEFKNEVVLTAHLQHRNLVRLLGCCIQGEERILIYEYMPNKSLNSIIFARTFVGNQTEENTKRVVGTYGYISPEYAKCGFFSIKSDVFSFGVLVLEIAWTLLTEGKALGLMDPSIEDPVTVSEVLKCIQVSLLCVQKFPEDMLKMSSVFVMLDTDGLMLPWPKQPGFFVQEDLSATQNKL
ncbi:hypothetical protein IFM89_000590, partial [Coptis chinensis]